MENTISLQEAALSYLEQGFSVIPVGADKKPRLKQWKAYQTRLPSREEVLAWFQSSDTTGVAIVTGKISDGLVVLDVEKNGDWEGLDIPPTSTVATGGGGRHFYFRGDQTNMPRNSVRFRDKMDIRGEGGYVLAPPSLHQSGQRYEWIGDFEKISPTPLPPWLMVEIGGSKRRGARSVARGVAEGQRNDASAVYAGSLLAKYSTEEWETKAWTELCEWNRQNIPPLEEDELRGVYESIMQRELAARGGVSVPPPTQTPEVELITEPLTLETVLSKTRNIGFVHDYCVEVAMAVYLSTFMGKEKNPLWLLVVGNPSANKTTLVYLLRYAPQTYRLDTMTANPFSSGQKENDKPKDLLPLINQRCFIVKDYSTLFGRNEEIVRQFVTDMVSIYDGEYTKHSPTRGTIRHESLFSHLGCITPMALNKRQQYMNMVGARFLQMEIPRLTDAQRSQGLMSIWQQTEFARMEQEAAIAVSSYCMQLKERLPSITLEAESEDVIEQINGLANLMAHARGIVLTEARKFITDAGKEQTHYEPIDIQIEEPFRALFQLRRLCRALALVRGKAGVTTEEVRTARRIVLSSMPPRRSEVLRAFGDGASRTAKEVAESMGKDQKTIKRHLDELCSLGVLKSRKDPREAARSYEPVETFRDVICESEQALQEASPSL